MTNATANTTKTYYTVEAHEIASWTQNADGTCDPIVLRDCGHRHRTEAAAEKCLDRLSAGGVAAWYHGVVIERDRATDSRVRG